MAEFEEKCIFCNIAHGRIKSKKIYEDEKVVAVLDIHPANPGHVLMIPKKHVLIFPMLDNEIVGHIFAIAKKISQIMLYVLKSKGSTFLVSNGIAAGQKAPHALLHIIPRYENDSVGLLPKLYPLDDSAIDKIKASLVRGIKDVFGDKNVVEEEKNENSSLSSLEDKGEKQEEKEKREEGISDREKREDNESSEEKKSEEDEEFNPDAIANIFLNK